MKKLVTLLPSRICFCLGMDAKGIGGIGEPMRFKHLALSALVFWCFVATGCSNNETPQTHAVGTGTPVPELEGCCEESFSVAINGDSPTGGRYYWAALMDRDTIVKAGDSVYLTGSFTAQEVTVSYNHRDRIPAGEYDVRVFGTDDPADVGKPRNRSMAAEAGRVQVSSFAAEDCVECDTLEVLYKTFIKCPVVDGTPFVNAGWGGYYSGDDRVFDYYSAFYRSYQIVRVLYNYNTRQWSMADAGTFGVTLEWDEDVLTDTAQGPCIYGFRTDTTFEPECQMQAHHGDPNESILQQQEQVHPIDTFHVRLDLEGHNPCVDFFSCDIDGHLDVWFTFVLHDGVYEPRYKLRIVHDEFPWHEVYISRNWPDDQPRYTWDATDNDIDDLCPVWGNQDFEDIWRDVE